MAALTAILVVVSRIKQYSCKARHVRNVLLQRPRDFRPRR